MTDDVTRDPRVLLAACLLHPLPLSLANAIKEVLAAAPQQQDAPDARPDWPYASAQVLDCEACLTPDACRIRGQCAQYLREKDKAQQQAEPVGYFWHDESDGGEWKHVADTAEQAAKLPGKIVPLYLQPRITAEQVAEIKRLADAAIDAAIAYGEATAPNVGEKLDEHLKARAAFHAALDALVKGE